MVIGEEVTGYALVVSSKIEQSNPHWTIARIIARKKFRKLKWQAKIQTKTLFQIIYYTAWRESTNTPARPSTVRDMEDMLER